MVKSRIEGLDAKISTIDIELELYLKELGL